MALQASTVWEVRTTGSDNNGGGYTSGGTDYSQQTTAELNPTDLAMTQSSTTLTSATGGFTAAMVGNIIQITAGTNFDTGFYEITVHTDTNTVTLDRTAASGGNGSGGTGYVGGALATIGKAVGAMVAGNDIYVKATATYSVASAIAPTVGGASSDDPSRLIGYTTTRTDNGRATISGTAAIYVIDFGAAGNYWHVKNFEIDGTDTATNGVRDGVGRVISLSNLKIHRIATNGIFSIGAGSLIEDCEITDMKAGAAQGIYLSGNNSSVDRCEIHNNPCLGIGLLRGAVHRCLVYDNTGDGINTATTAAAVTHIKHNTFYNNSGDGLDIDHVASIGSVVIEGNIFSDNGGYGINVVSSNKGPAGGGRNAYYNNTSGARNNLDALPGDVALTGDPFTDAASDDFSLNNTAGAGAACKAAAWGEFPSGNTTSYLDIGAAQSEATGGVIGGPSKRGGKQ